MNQVTLIRRKFLAALRSGKYIKGQTILIQEDDNGNKTYCVLGVLYTISPIKPEHLDGIYDAADTLLGVPKIGTALWMMNDDTIKFTGHEYTFADIADKLEHETFRAYPIKPLGTHFGVVFAMNDTPFSYIDVSSAFELVVRDNAPEGLVIQLRDMTDGGSMSTVCLPKEEVPELAYVLMNIAKEIVLPQQRLLT